MRCFPVPDLAGHPRAGGYAAFLVVASIETEEVCCRNACRNFSELLGTTVLGAEPADS